jgi:hypothetical protein
MAKRLSPIGRIVQGNPLKMWPVIDDTTKQPKMKKDNSGPRQQWYMNVAFSKQDPDTMAMVTEIWQEAARSFPQFFPQGVQPTLPNFGCSRSDFAIKLVDGDGVDQNGQPHGNKEGFAGHWIVKVKTEAGQMRCYDGLNNNAIITDEEHIHTGKYVRVSLDFTGNGWQPGQNTKPGLFMNPDGVQLVGHGPKIQNGPDANTMFAQPATAGYVPAGMSMTPVASASMPGTPSPQPQPMATAPIYTMTAAAQGFTREQYHGQGWTDEALVAKGMMTISQPAPVTPAPQPQPMAAPQPQMMPQPQPAPQPMGMAPQMQAPAPQPQMAPMAAPQPQIAQPQAFTQPIAQPQRTYTMTPSAQGYTREQWHAAGQTDESLVAAGMMVIS